MSPTAVSDHAALLYPTVEQTAVVQGCTRGGVERVVLGGCSTGTLDISKLRNINKVLGSRPYVGSLGL